MEIVWRWLLIGLGAALLILAIAYGVAERFDTSGEYRACDTDGNCGLRGVALRGGLPAYRGSFGPLVAPAANLWLRQTPNEVYPVAGADPARLKTGDSAGRSGAPTEPTAPYVGPLVYGDGHPQVPYPVYSVGQDIVPYGDPAVPQSGECTGARATGVVTAPPLRRIPYDAPLPVGYVESGITSADSGQRLVFLRFGPYDTPATLTPNPRGDPAGVSPAPPEMDAGRALTRWSAWAGAGTPTMEVDQYFAPRWPVPSAPAAVHTRDGLVHAGWTAASGLPFDASQLLVGSDRYNTGYRLQVGSSIWTLS